MRRLGTTGAAWSTPHRSRIRALGAVLVLCALVGTVLAQEARKAWLIKLEGMINTANVEAVKRKIEQARFHVPGYLLGPHQGTFDVLIVDGWEIAAG